MLILSQDVFNERSGTVIAVALTSQPQRAGFPLTLELQAKGLPKKSWVKISQIRTLAVERIGQRLGKMSPENWPRSLKDSMRLSTPNYVLHRLAVRLRF